MRIIPAPGKTLDEAYEAMKAETTPSREEKEALYQAVLANPNQAEELISDFTRRHPFSETWTSLRIQLRQHGF